MQKKPIYSYVSKIADANNSALCAREKTACLPYNASCLLVIYKTSKTLKAYLILERIISTTCITF